MKIRLVSILLLALLLAHSTHAIAGIATTTIGVGATVVAACTLPMSGQSAGEISTSCTPQTSVRIGEASTEQNLMSGDAEQQPMRITEQSGQSAQTKEVMIEF
jgi:hypothetical protein